ncbi:MAG: hypothetical protein H6550_13615 [Chitinophagales bacterium]|nr:hypothetical protein [Chitinophagales bacterium]
MKLKFGSGQINEHAPKWMINAASVLTLLVVAKDNIVNGLPGIDHAMHQIVKAWADYLLDTLQLFLALAVIFTGEQKTGDNDTA